jgi:peptidoglycan biosynthesis protein MviN/MurJ (putative lipid II flippase)
LCCIGSIVAIVLGAIAVRQVKRTGQDGFGLAVAGIVIGIATLAVTLVFVIFAGMHTR